MPTIAADRDDQLGGRIEVGHGKHGALAVMFTHIFLVERALVAFLGRGGRVIRRCQARAAGRATYAYGLCDSRVHQQVLIAKS